MAIVLALVIVGWLLAFAVGAQAGFDNQPEVAKSVSSGSSVSSETTAAYRNPASAA